MVNVPSPELTEADELPPALGSSSAVEPPPVMT